VASIFVPDGVCGHLEEQSAQASSPQDAVKALLRTRALARLGLAEPRIRVESGSAIVDLRLRDGVKGSLDRLSVCDQQMLLHSIRHTLRGNARWGIERVVFFEKGSLFAM
jgi:hypothetical protein